MSGIRRVQVLVVGAGRAGLAAGHHLRRAGPAPASVPAGRIADRLGVRGPVLVLAAGVDALAAAYGSFTIDTAGIAMLAVPFVLAGAGIGSVETAQHSAVAALAPKDLCGSAFGLLATAQSLGNLAASTVAG
ncbi:MFS transporter [Kitasatospora sp. NPDC101176]|uniref:MFS transporter n=1 Tax=Kitasatospora sp. NPDC101176 TaxID=3364099 RepID=UPI0037F998E2